MSGGAGDELRRRRGCPPVRRAEPVGAERRVLPVAGPRGRGRARRRLRHRHAAQAGPAGRPPRPARRARPGRRHAGRRPRGAGSRVGLRGAPARRLRRRVRPGHDDRARVPGAAYRRGDPGHPGRDAGRDPARRPGRVRDPQPGREGLGVLGRRLVRRPVRGHHGHHPVRGAQGRGRPRDVRRDHRRRPLARPGRRRHAAVPAPDRAGPVPGRGRAAGRDLLRRLGPRAAHRGQPGDHRAGPAVIRLARCPARRSRSRSTPGAWSASASCPPAGSCRSCRA